MTSPYPEGFLERKSAVFVSLVVAGCRFSMEDPAWLAVGRVAWMGAWLNQSLAWSFAGSIGKGCPLSAGLAELVICELEVVNDGFSSYWERPLESLINIEERDTVPAGGPRHPPISGLTNVDNRLFFIRSSEIGFLPLEIYFSILELFFSKKFLEIKLCFYEFLF